MAALAQLTRSIKTSWEGCTAQKGRQEENKHKDESTELKTQNGCLQRKNSHNPHEGVFSLGADKFISQV